MMNRRRFLDATVVAGTALLWPVWLRQAFADADKCSAEGVSRVANAFPSAATLSEAFRRARRTGRPLFVIVIPADDGDKYARGRAWGELINFGTDEQIAPLSSVEVACATMEVLKLVVPNQVSGEPFFAVVSNGATPSTVKGFGVEIPVYTEPERSHWDEHTWEELERHEELVAQQRIATLAGAVRRALGAPGGDVAARAADARERLKVGPPPGAHWARSSGCGVMVEGAKDNIAFGCGMGHVPAKSRRFLYFFANNRSAE
jgi:hypothetical protein